MATARNEANEKMPGPLARVWPLIDSAFDRIFSESNKSILKNLAIRLSVAGFAIHLLLIFLARTLSHPPFAIAEVGRNYLNAISTPFNFILFYEVLTLIAALPVSTTRSIANQYEIVSLIFIREVFKDISSASGLVTGRGMTLESLPMFMDMWAGFLMYLLVAVFEHVAQKRVAPKTSQRSPGLLRFMAQKRLVAVGLAMLLVGMAAYNLGLFATVAGRMIVTGQGTMGASTTFYNDAFTVMIFTDVLVLILSLVVSGRYDMVFRNAAFVVSIILLRFSLTQGYPYGAPLAVVAMVFGILTLMVFNYHMRLNVT